MLQFTAGSNKGGVVEGEVWNDPFHLGKMTDERAVYTSAFVPEEVELDAQGKATLHWTPVRDAKVIDAESGVSVEILDAAKGEIKVIGASGKVKVGYIYDNVVIPQNDLPILNAHMEGMPLSAKARRIAIYYSQMAA